MSLRFIYGRSGSGKTHLCLNEIRGSLLHNAENPQNERRLVLLVPEQYTFQAERDLIKVLETGGILKTEVLSFRRLAFRVFNEAGGITQPRLHSAGKCMILYKIINQFKNDLNIFAKTAERQGFANILSGMVTEFKRYNVTPAELRDAISGLQDETLLKEKLSELTVIYEEYEKILFQKYRDADDDLTMAALKLDNCALYEGAEIWIDGFSGFTPQEYKVISRLLAQAGRVTVCLCTDSLIREDYTQGTDVFENVRECAERLSRVAKEKGIEIEPPVYLRGKLPRFTNSPELSHLEQNFFAFPPSKYSGKTKDISLFSAVNIFSEIEAVAGDIIRLCRDEGMRYRDIAVITGNLESYQRLIEVIFAEYDIPCFLDNKTDIDQHPLVRLILSMMEIFINNWSYESVFRYLKTGLTGVEKEDIDQIENYVLACGIRGKTWLREDDWCMSPDIIPGKNESESGKRELAEINCTRRAVVSPLMEFRQKTKGNKSATEICTALYDFLQTIGVPQRMEDQIEAFRRNGNLNLANEYAQVWNILMEVFDQTVEVLGTDTYGLKSFAAILEIGLAEYKIGLIPVSPDQVLVGSADRSKSHDIKALFILGVNDGVFPSSALNEGLLSDADRITLRRLGVGLASDTRTKAFDEQYLIYRALTATSQYLRLSWAIADQEGKSLRPSIIISRIRKVFSNLTELSNITGKFSADGEADLVAGRLPAFKQMVTNLRQKAEGLEHDPVWEEVYRWFAAQSSWQLQCQAVRAAFQYKNIALPVSREEICSLYGDPVQTSVSRLERYASCSFAWYLQYGLMAKDRKIFQLTPPDMGTFMHAVIEKFSLELVEKNISWRDLDRQFCEEKVSSVVDEMLAKMKGSGISASKRMTALTVRLKRVLVRAVLLISEHIRRSSFEPVAYELGFGEGEEFPPIIIELETGQKINLNGRIDRVDSLKTENGTYLRIIDYKSGSKDFRLSDVYYGLQIQLVTYLDALSKNNRFGNEEPVIPGGILYFHLDDPIIKGKGKSTEQEIELAIMKQLKMKGLLLADVKVIRDMDNTIEGSSLIIPARINKGDVLGKSSVASSDQFTVLKDYVQRLLGELCSEIINGNVAIRPYKKKNNSSCDYCNFSAVCQFDSRLKENNFRLLNDQIEEDIWSLMSEGGYKNGRQ